MKAVKLVVATAVSAIAFALYSSSIAQQVTRELGSPSATTTISGKQLPPPDPSFGGVIKEEASQSTPWWPPRVVPPKGAPNVLLIMTRGQGIELAARPGRQVPADAAHVLAEREQTFNPRRDVDDSAGGEGNLS
jgi:hypothetical protein